MPTLNETIQIAARAISGTSGHWSEDVLAAMRVLSANNRSNLSELLAPYGGLARLFRDGGFSGIPGGGGPTPPAIGTISPYYNAGLGEYRNVPWSATIAPWFEPALGSTQYPIFNLMLPPLSAASYGWTSGYPVVTLFQSAGTPFVIAAGGAMDINLRQPLLTLGIAVACCSAPHPAITAGTPYDAWQEYFQFLRSYDVALGLDSNLIASVGRSRGNYSFATSMMTDRINPAGLTYKDTKSGICLWHYGLNTQSVYDLIVAAPYFVTDDPAEQASFLSSDPSNIAGVPSPFLLVTTGPQVPYFTTSYDATYPGGKVAAALINGETHWPGSGEEFFKRFRDRGIPHKFNCWDNVAAGGDAENMGPAAWWFKNMFDGCTNSREAMAAATGKQYNQSVIYLPSNLSGGYQLTDGTNVSTPLTTAGNPIGSIADGAEGWKARPAAVPTGKPMGQPTGGQRPDLVAQFPSGYWPFTFTGTDRGNIARGGSNQDGYSYDTVEKRNAPEARTGLAASFGQPGLLNRNVGLILCADNIGDITAQQFKRYDLFASLVTGKAYDPLTLQSDGIAAARALDMGYWYTQKGLSNLRQNSDGTALVSGTQRIGRVYDRQYDDVLGATLVANGTFPTDLSSWTSADTGTGVSSFNTGGGMRLNGTGGANLAIRRQTVTTVVGRTYRVGMKYAITSGTAPQMRVGTTSGGTEVWADSTLTSRIFVATTTTTFIQVQSDSAAASNSVLSAVTLQEIQGYHLTQATAADRATLAIQSNGQPAYGLDGVSDFLLSTRSPGVSGTIVWAGIAPASGTARALFGAGGTQAAEAGASLRVTSANLPSFEFGDGASASSIVGTALTPGTAYVIIARWQANVQQLYVNNVQAATAASALVPTASRTFTVGRNGSDLAAGYNNTATILAGHSASYATDAQLAAIANHALNLILGL